MQTHERESDPKEELRFLNDNMIIVRVTRLIKRTRMFICGALAVFAGAGIAVGGIFSFDSIMIAITSIIGAFCASVGVWWFVSHINSVTHKAVCVISGGKVSEFIFSRKGGFIYNTVEGEVIYEKGKLIKNRHKWAYYEPSYPYADFLDRDYSGFLKARTGEGYEGGESYAYSGDDEIKAFYDDECKKVKFSLKVEDNKPYRMEYKGQEIYVYSKLNQAGQTVFIPSALKGKVTPPPYLNVRYVDVKDDFKKLWEQI